MFKKKQTLSKGSTRTRRLALEKCITARNSLRREKTGTSLSVEASHLLRGWMMSRN